MILSVPFFLRQNALLLFFCYFNKIPTRLPAKISSYLCFLESLSCKVRDVLLLDPCQHNTRRVQEFSDSNSVGSELHPTGSSQSLLMSYEITRTYKGI